MTTQRATTRDDISLTTVPAMARQHDEENPNTPDNTNNGATDEESTPSSFSLKSFRVAARPKTGTWLFNGRGGLPQTGNPMSKNENPSVFCFTPEGRKEDIMRGRNPLSVT